MKGIIDDNLTMLVKKNNFNVESLTKDVRAIVDIVDGMDDCYSGNGIDFVFAEVLAQKDNINKIPGIAKNYSEVLDDVKIAYNQQNIRFHEIFNNAKQ